MISKFIRVNGTGRVTTQGGYRDIFVHGYFYGYGYYFIVHQDLQDSELVTVSEASTGYQLQDESYYTIEDALYFARIFLEKKKCYLPTSISHTLVKTQRNFLKINTQILKTLAIDTALWL